jgi:hypothetical protein
MSRRTRRTLLIVAAVLVLLGVAVFLRSKAPPEAARLLPESDGIIYIDLRPIRAIFHHDLKPLERAPDYQQFVDATGIDWERDVNQIAIALHRMPDSAGPNGPVAYSMIIAGKITGQRLNNWLTAHATTREIYAGHIIYSIPSEGRTVRVTQIGYDMVGVSNTPTPEQIHSILDRHRTAALPFSGSTLLERHYHEVPLLSLAWGVGQIGLPFTENGEIHVLGLGLPIESDSTIIASISPALSVPHAIGALRLRVEDIAPSNAAATTQAAALATLITLARSASVPLSNSKTNQALKDLLNTAQVTQHQERIIVTATLPASFLSTL